VCLVDGAQLAGQSFPGGHCTRPACDYPANECDNDTVCESLRPWLGDSESPPLCFQSCKVGAESTDLRIGVKGHGEGCREGYRCHYNGGAGADSGVCVGGNYNAVTANNIGQTCETNADCYSPFGLGYCAKYQIGNVLLPGNCTLLDCSVAGLPVDICGDKNACVSQGPNTDETSCEHSCKDATECGNGFACTDADGDSDTPNTCIPLCESDANCRAGEKCIIADTARMLAVCQLQ
jgi:hypothetical protein